MKINWGIGASLVLVVFCITIATVVISTNTTEIEEKNYYSKDISIREDLRETKNAKELKVPLRFENSQSGLKIIFPSQFKRDDTTGTVMLLRYSDSKLDRKFDIYFSGSHFMLIPRKELKEGLYKITVSWKNSIDSYLITKDITWK